MAEGVPARLSAATGRKFGFTVGLAFLVIGAALFWRHKPLRADVVSAIGGILVVGAFAAPVALLPVERAWMASANVMSRVTTPIFMGVVYFLVITPIGLVRRVFTASSRRDNSRRASFWVAHTPPPDPHEAMERQF